MRAMVAAERDRRQVPARALPPQFHKFHNAGMGGAKPQPMPTFTTCELRSEPATEERAPGQPVCYSLAVFTQRWRDVRDFYIELLGARVLSEKPNAYCEMEVGGVPLCLRQCEHGEASSYFHLYLALEDRTNVLKALRHRGIVVTDVGPYTNFRDPEGRVIKLSDAPTLVG
jgi:catechol 2,3-dioxygenase-like lactoylglutathione lyase family enzyme